LTITDIVSEWMLFELLSAVFSLRSVRLEFETISNRMACPLRMSVFLKELNCYVEWNK